MNRTIRTLIPFLVIAAISASLPVLAAGRSSTPKLEEDDYIIFLESGRSIMSLTNFNFDSHTDFGGLSSGTPSIWFRADGRNYVVRDRALVARASALFEEKGETKSAREALRRDQHAIEAKERQIDRESDRLDAESDRISDDEHLSEARRDELSRELDGKRRELDRASRELDDESRALDERERALDDQQEELERRAEVQLRALFREAIRSGAAILDRK